MTGAIEEITDGVPGSPGTILRRLRESRNLSIAEVAQRLKYGQRQIEALERDDFNKLPGMTFVRGMIRGYARLLGADPGAVLLELERKRVPDPMTVDLRVSRIPFPDGKRRTTKIYGALSILLVFVAIMIGYEVLPWPTSGGVAVVAKPPHDEIPQGNAITTDGALPVPPLSSRPQHEGEVALVVPPGAMPSSTNVPVPAASPAPGPQVAPASTPVTGSKRIALHFDRESWVEIKQADGKTLLSQLNPGGTKQIVQGIPPFLVIIGNAPNVQLSYDDQPVDLRPHFKVDVARLTLE